MAFKVYTKTGDNGMTGLFGGARVPKHHIRIEAYGTVDELNAHMGLIRDQLKEEQLRTELRTLQEKLFTLGAVLAAEPGKDNSFLPKINAQDVELLEKSIDRMEESLTPLTSFVLPGGHPLVSQTHVARCVCRRAERYTVALNENEAVDAVVLQFLNRFSDYLFVLSRFICQKVGAEEVKWMPEK